MRISRNDFIIQQPYLEEGDSRWYVQQIALLDYGRFDTQYEAAQHLEFLNEQKSSSS